MKKLVLPDIRRGASSDIPIRIETDVLSFVPIASISKSAPMRVVTSSTHGMPDGWRGAIVDAKGLTEMNASSSIRDSELHRVTVINATTLDFNNVSSLNFNTHTALTGVIAFYTPKDLSVYTSARMDLKKTVSGSIIATFSTVSSTLQIDNTAKALWLRLTAANLSAITAGQYLFDIEMVRASGVDALCTSDSTVNILNEITTSS